MKRKLFSIIVFFISLVFFSCGINENSKGKIVFNLPYGRAVVSQRDVSSEVPVSYVFYLRFENKEANLVIEKTGKSNDEIVIEEAEPGKWTVAAVACADEYSEKFDEYALDGNVDFYTVENHENGFPYYLGASELEVTAGETSNVLLKLKRVLQDNERVVGIDVQLPETEDNITFENYKEILAHCKVTPSYRIFRGDEPYSEIYSSSETVADFVIGDIAENSIGYVPVTFTYEENGYEVSSSVNAPIMYALPEGTLKPAGSGVVLAYGEECVLDYSLEEAEPVKLTYFEKDATEGKEVYLSPRLKNSDWIIEVDEKETIDENVKQSFKYSIDTTKPSHYFIKAEFELDGEITEYDNSSDNVIEMNVFEAEEFITGYKLSSQWKEITVLDAETVKTIKSFTPELKEDYKPSESFSIYDFTFKLVYECKKLEEVWDEESDVDIAHVSCSEIAENTFGYVPATVTYDNGEDPAITANVVVPVTYEMEAAQFEPYDTVFDVPLYSEIEFSNLELTSKPEAVTYYNKEGKAVSANLGFGKYQDVLYKKDTALTSNTYTFNKLGELQFYIVRTYSLEMKDGSDASVEFDDSLVIVDREYKSNEIDVTVIDYDLEVYAESEDGFGFDIIDSEDGVLEIGKKCKLTIVNPAVDEKSAEGLAFMNNHIKWTVDSTEVKLEQKNGSVVFTVPEKKPAEQTFVFTAVFDDNKLWDYTLIIPAIDNYVTTVAVGFPSYAIDKSLSVSSEVITKEDIKYYVFTAESDNKEIVSYRWKVNGHEITDGVESNTLTVSVDSVTGKTLNCIALNKDGEIIENFTVRIVREG